MSSRFIWIVIALHGVSSATTAPSSAESAEDSRMGWSQLTLDDLSLDSGPSFDPSTPRNVTVLVGRTAHLQCRVRSLGNRTVSWVRHRDVHILTVGRYTYTTDQRFSVVRSRHLEDWILQIKYSQAKDAGLYECQVSTQPHRSLFVQLNVIVPRATIIGGADLHVDVGSHVNLTCIVHFSPDPPSYVFWYHQDQVINHESPRGGVAIITDKSKTTTTSSLLLRHVKASDSGKYNCIPSNADPATVTLHVIQDEYPAAMQSNGARSICWSMAFPAPFAVFFMNKLTSILVV